MSLVELKQAARDHKPPIKQYYIKSRLELIKLLSMKELPQTYVLEKKTIAELRKEAIEKGHKNIWKLKKADLLDLLYPRSQQNNKDNDHAKKHDDPKYGESE
jgi:hypothetical protein